MIVVEKEACTNMFLILDKHFNYSFLAKMDYDKAEELRQECFDITPIYFRNGGDLQ